MDVHGSIPPTCPSFSHTLWPGCTHWQKGRWEKMSTQVLEVDLGHLNKRFPGPGCPKCGLEGNTGFQRTHPSVSGAFHSMEGTLAGGEPDQNPLKQGTQAKILLIQI